MASVTSSIIPNRLSAVLSRSRPKYESGGNSRLVSNGVLTYLQIRGVNVMLCRPAFLASELLTLGKRH